MFSEIDLLTSFKHPNIVSLLGVSNDNKEMIIIYEDDFKGSLHDYLGHPHRMAYLNWAARIQISLDIARALRYLQTFGIKEKQRIMQFAMNSTNILLDAERKAKIACFWLSNLFSADKEANINNTIAKEVQSDVECIKIEKLKSESAIYSFGVILFEILCGKVQYDKTYYSKKEKGLPVIARRCMDEETFLNVMIDPNLKRETDEKTCVLNEEVDKKSFDAFSQIAYKCCAVREAERPSMDVIIEELEKAKNSQVKHFELLKNGIVEKVKNLIPSIAYEDISSATKEFSKDNIIGSGGYSKVYKGELAKFDSCVAIKQIHAKKDKEGSNGFLAEIQALSNYKHSNIVSLLGFCLEKDEMILVLEYASKGSLDRILRNSDMISNLTWAERINICLNIASGLSYLHTIIDGKQTIHRDIKSANILLNDKWEAKIADFGLCKLNHAYQQSDNMNANIIAGTDVYLDPEYLKTGRLQVESDIYSLGVVLFEILCGKLAYDESFGEGGLPPVARKCFKDGTLKQMIDQRMSKDDEDNSVLNGRVDQNSVQTFSKIAYKCLAEKQRDRPNIKDVIVELKKAYDSQKYSMDKLRMSLEEVRSMTKNFSDSKCIREGRCWKQYEGEMAQANGYIINVVAKLFDSKYDTQHQYFKRELDILSDSKHKNIVGLVRYCQDMDETIIVYEHASNGTLDVHLKNTSVTWMKRLKISIDIASGLHFLHKHGVVKDFWITHTDIRSFNILINGDWTAKISNLESSLYNGEHPQVEHVNDDAHRSLGYMDPKNKQSEHVTHKSDIYSLGVVLLEMLCGRLAWEEGCEDHSLSLGPLAKQHFNEGKLDDLVFKGIKDQINPQALDAFVDIAFKCLEDDVGKRPEARAVEIQLRKALDFQEDHEVWEPKLRQYQDMLLLSEMMDKNTRKNDAVSRAIKWLKMN
ncbi:hypothetical protein QVD17_12912 [Tagetes erecta]|uniref:non-specific serine/threonine protein kinase n=1 Tax=Tagetes erecta TaxID=13708 RepID=A0AAD8P2Z9_TARER|nr:hypothetical protein QVD17_12912 [Tagetes erecta]